MHTDPLDEKARTEDILYELLLKAGVELIAEIEKKNNFYFVNNNLIVALEKMDEEVVKEILSEKPHKVLTSDRLFNNNDQLKTNTALQMKDAEIYFTVV